MAQSSKSTKKSPGQKKLSKKIALVTGGGIRVGRSICLSLARAGYRMLVHYHRSKSLAMELEKEIIEIGSECALVQADLTLKGEPERLISKAVALFGGLDLLVNSAAVFVDDHASDSDLDSMRRLNEEAPRALAEAALPHLKESCGSIVNIADAFGLVPFKTHKKYSATKMALLEMTYDLAIDYAPQSVRVNAICPGTVLPKETYGEAEVTRLTSAIPLGRIGRPEDVGEAVLFLAGADFITGQVLRVDGGLALKMERENKNGQTSR